ncbi:replicative DNA helicase [Streptacidiphilus carbonis]|uniref:replicative DNA helicase n=1 Tax=Streptacidiphilus carbonis TaxID=105422 RepID=UPI0005AB16FF|nr:DnaB-like helicase C-terminal domain-containing protein [Streptacidiphilus carbonis]
MNDQPEHLEEEDPRPRDLSAERALLGSMLLGERAIDDATDTLAGPGDYYRTAHATIHTAILEVHGQPGITPDPITVGAQLLKVGELDRIGGSEYLHRLVAAVPVSANADWYAGIVRDTAKLRRIYEIAARTVRRSLERDNPDDILDTTIADLQALILGSPKDAPKLSVGERWDDFIDQLEAGEDPNALDTPWKDLNEVTSFKPGDLIAVGAETSGGKSLLGFNCAAHVALRRNRPVLVASMEMGGTELLARLTAAEASVNLSRLVNRKLIEPDWERIAKVADRLRNATNFILDDSPGLSLSKIRARVRWMHSTGNPPALVVADYLQLIAPEGPGSRNRTQEVADISRGLKLLAMEFQVPVMALAQFNRGQVGRKPLVSDFKDSSQIEQDSNVILLISKDIPDDPANPGPDNGVRHLEVGKNRNGPRGREVDLEQQGHYARLVTLV